MNPLVIIDNNDNNKAYEIDGECIKTVDDSINSNKSKYFCNIKEIQYVNEECHDLSNYIKGLDTEQIKKCVYSYKSNESNDFCNSLFSDQELKKMETCHKNNTKIDIDNTNSTTTLQLDPNWKFGYLLQAVDQNKVIDICFGDNYPISNKKCPEII